MELIDSDFFLSNNNGDDFIDRFVVNVTTPGQVRGSYPGILGLATIDMTTEIVCEPEFTGMYCEITINSTDSSGIGGTPVFVLLLSLSLLAAVVVLAVIFCCTVRRLRNKKSTSHFMERNSIELTTNGAYRNPVSDHSYAYPPSTLIEEMRPNVETAEPLALYYQFDICPAYNTCSQSVETDDIQPSSHKNYNYESPYWLPSNEEAELLSQFKDLRMRSVAQKDLE